MQRCTHLHTCARGKAAKHCEGVCREAIYLARARRNIFLEREATIPRYLRLSNIFHLSFLSFFFFFRETRHVSLACSHARVNALVGCFDKLELRTSSFRRDRRKSRAFGEKPREFATDDRALSPSIFPRTILREKNKERKREKRSWSPATFSLDILIRTKAHSGNIFFQ